eukprot:4816755-Amphidinium_carterae.1
MLTNLGDVYGSLGDYTKQRDFLERALRTNESQYGPEHPAVAVTLHRMSLASATHGDLASAHEQAMRALRIFEASSLSAEHPHALAMKRNLSQIERKLQMRRIWSWTRCWRNRRGAPTEVAEPAAGYHRLV